MADILLLGGREQGQVLACGKGTKVIKGLGAPGLIELDQVPIAEQPEQLTIVAKPGTKPGRRGNGFAPLVEVSLLLGQAPRPKAVNQHPGSIARTALVVGASNADRVHMCHW